MHDFLISSIQAAVDAGSEILDIYRSDFSVRHKLDGSPLTRADDRSHCRIVSALAPLDLPILSEEGREIPWAERRGWGRLWIVDPLDGTKEFVNRRDEFTVNIALVENGCPRLGVIFVPVTGTLYFAVQNLGAFRVSEGLEEILPGRTGAGQTKPALDRLISHAVRLPVISRPEGPLAIIGSRSHNTEALDEFIAEKRRTVGQIEFVAAGSSLKFCRVAEGTADLYPRLGPTMEWDTAAGQAIAECAGAEVTDFHATTPLVYNKQDLHNPWFLVARPPGRMQPPAKE
jgi:3'(2'), 5'-bisphosphate nucleotidase